MNGRDLEAFLRVVGDPKKREQVAQKMREQGMSDKDVKKAEKEAQEFSRLKQIEKMRELTDDEKKRLDEINNSKEFQRYADTYAKENGINYSAQNNASMTNFRNIENSKDSIETGKTSLEKIQISSNIGEDLSKSRGFGTIANARDASPQLAKTPELTKAFTQSNVVQLASKTSPSSDFEDSLDEKTTPKKPTQVAKVQDSFSASL